MCHFITATLPAEADLDAVARVFAAHALGCAPIANAHVQRQLPAGDHYVLTTRGHCDCGTPLGAGHDDSPMPSGRELEKLRKSGWGEAKIRRWLDEKRGTRDRSARNAEVRGATRVAALTEWIALIDDALVVVPRVGLLVHRYRGGIATERVDVTRERRPRREIDAAWLGSLREDIVYEIERDPRR